MDKLSNPKLITCILPKGRGSLVEKALVEEKDIHTANLNHARGVGKLSVGKRRRGLGAQQEKDILSVSVSADQADDVFAFMFFKGEMGQPHGGIIYMTSLSSGTEMNVADLPTEE